MTARTLRIAGAQLPVGTDPTANMATLRRAIAQAVAHDAEILLTPEGSLSGYTHRINGPLVARLAKELAAEAAEARLGLALGTCYIEEDGRCRNEVRLYSRSGQFIGYHTKTLTCGTLEPEPKGEIQHYTVDPLRVFEFEGVTLGALICNDLWANPGCTPQDDPHLTQKLAAMGAQVILHAVNGGRDGSEGSKLAWMYHESNLRMRAMAAGIPIVTVDNSAPATIPCSAPSGVVGPDGNWIVQAPVKGEHVFVVDLKL